MMRTKKGALGVTLGAAVALTAAACSSGGSTPAATSGSTGTGAGAAAGQKGGTLYMLSTGPKEHWDPQRMYIGADIEFASRVFTRTLTTFSAEKTPKLVADLATDTGTVSDGGKTWKFTLRDGVKWEDGQDVKCEDIKYGISRTFAQDVITGGPNYIITFLDVPTKKDAKGNDVSAYEGPYTKVGQELYDKAVTCEGKTITFKFKTPWTDFNQAATFPAFGGFRQDKDKGAESDYAVFSNGPYKLEGAYDKDKGGKFVRNTNWSEASDTLRKAYPDVIQVTEGITSQDAYARLIADSGDDKNAVTALSAPSAALAQIAGSPEAQKRMYNGPAPYVDYIQPNVKSAVFSNEKVRLAFAMATNREAYVTAFGGPTVMSPSYALCNKELACYKDFNVTKAPTTGDAEGAKKLLAEAGVAMPVKVTVPFRDRGDLPKAMAALKESWDKGGFEVTLEPLKSQGYYSTIQGPAMASKDAFWAGWGADWPSGSTVIPALMDGRVNISAGGSGQDYGYFNDPEVNKAIDAAYLITDATAREKAWGDIDEMIAKKGGVIPLVNQKFTFLYGSNVKGFQTNSLLGGYVDLATIAVK